MQFDCMLSSSTCLLHVGKYAHDDDHTSLYNILQGIKRSSYLVLTNNTIGAYQQHDMCGALTPLLKMAKKSQKEYELKTEKR